MKTFWRFFLLKFLLKVMLIPLFSYSSIGFAQTTVDPATQNMNRAMSGIIQSAMRNRGYVPSDPRTYNTLSRVGGVVAVAAGGAATISIGAITAPAWVSFALAVAAGSVIAYGVNLALDSALKWYFGSDGLIDETGGGLTPASVPGTVVGDFVWCTNQGAGGGCSSSGEAMSRQAAQDLVSSTGSSYSSLQSITCTNTTATSIACTTKFVAKSNGSTVNGPTIYVNRQTGSVVCPGGSFYRSGACRPLTFVSDASKSDLSPDAAVDGLSQSELDKKLNPAILAALANQAWKQAASQPGYDGLPYPYSNPVSTDEATTWTQANPQYAPTVRDFVSPNPVTTSNPQPWALPSDPTAPVTTPTTQTNPNVTNPAEQNPLTNLGPDPGTGAPTLEPIPTAQQILDPVLNMLPGHRSYTANSYQGICPTPTINLYGSHVMDAHCTLIDQNKSVIQSAMTFAWAVIALFIVLSA